MLALLAATVPLASGASAAPATQAPVPPQHVAVGGFASPAGDGFSLVFADGSVRPRPLGDAFSLRLAAGVVGATRTPAGDGMWEVAADGNVFAVGNAVGYGGTGGGVVNAPTVGIAATRSGRGYWIAARDGGVFAFGDAAFRGSAAGRSLHQPVVGISASPIGGYRLVARDGGVFGFGAATFLGSLPSRHVRASDIVGLATTPTGKGYWIARSDGRVYDFGDAQHFGGVRPAACDRITAIVSNPAAPGYRLVTQSGRTYARGAAPGGTEPTGFRRSCGNATARIELPRTTIVAGTAVIGQLVIDNQSGHPLRDHKARACKASWAVDLVDPQHPARVIFPVSCHPGRTVIPVGEHQFGFTIPASRTRELPPGDYEARFLHLGGNFPNVAPLPVTIVAPPA